MVKVNLDQMLEKVQEQRQRRDKVRDEITNHVVFNFEEDKVDKSITIKGVVTINGKTYIGVQPQSFDSRYDKFRIIRAIYIAYAQANDIDIGIKLENGPI